MIQKIELSKNGIELSTVVLGLWRLPDVSINEITSLINNAIDLGVTSIDEADIYGNYTSQEFFGRALKSDKSLRQKLQKLN